jgi:hypothetical protein
MPGASQYSHIMTPRSTLLCLLDSSVDVRRADASKQCLVEDVCAVDACLSLCRRSAFVPGHVLSRAGFVPSNRGTVSGCEFGILPHIQLLNSDWHVCYLTWLDAYVWVINRNLGLASEFGSAVPFGHRSLRVLQGVTIRENCGFTKKNQWSGVGSFIASQRRAQWLK